MLCNRLKSVLPVIVDSNQGAFVEGRLILHNILITQELIRLYRRKGISSRCLLKIDLKKAYDCVEWGFLEECLKGYGFPRRFTEWIMECVSSTTFSLSLNGSNVGFFSGKRGLRQGDPISPLLFVILMEYLTRLLREVADLPGFQFHPLCKNMRLSNICFADDLMIFSKADLVTVKYIKKALTEFSRVSGLKANPMKSEIYMGGVDNMLKQELCNLVGFKEGGFPMKYLGVPLSPRKWNQTDCQAVVDKVVKRLKCWSTRHLSYAGRLQLINSVLMHLHVYWSSVFILPRSVTEAINRKCREFLWGVRESGRYCALVGWETVCRSKSEGGLSIHDATLWNEAAILKQVWWIASKKDSLWLKWVNEVYLKKENIWDIQCKPDSSWPWKQILKMRDKAREGFENDRWKSRKKGDYTVSSGYKWLQGEGRKEPAAAIIWSRVNVPKHAFITWLVWKGKLWTRDRLLQLNIPILDAGCCLCSDQLETTEHLFFQCPFSAEILEKMIQWLGIRTVSVNMARWKKEIMQICRKTRFRKQIVYATLVACIYGIWEERNNRIFRNQRRNVEGAFQGIQQVVRTRLQVCKSRKLSARESSILHSLM